MIKIKLVFWGLLLAVTGLWLLADTPFPAPGFFPIRAAGVQYTGLVAIAAMSVAIVLAVRPRSVEAPLGGLDKMYRLHKWLGIAALAFGTLHWLWAQGTKWAVGWGWLERPQRGPGGPGAAGGIAHLLREQRGLAETIGEWAFYAAALLIILALVRRFPYRLFVKTHKLLALVYLALACHAIVLVRTEYWMQPVGMLTAALLAAGTVGSAIVLLGRVGAGRKVAGRIDSRTYYPELRVLETDVMLEPGWRGHKAGQFAFVTSDRKEGAHPYTIASAWDAATQRIKFVTKALGDHTSTLADSLKAGDAVEVEGPYGCFTFEDRPERQIWIGAGIGITPFIARLKHLARMAPRSRGEIDLFHPTADFSPAAIDKLTADAEAAGIRLHVLVSPRDGLLDGAQIRAAIPAWQSASIWFCGPPAFGEALRKDLLAHGLNARHFHQELFQMR